jgi:shikimate 5-dehydrogenase
MLLDRNTKIYLSISNSPSTRGSEYYNNLFKKNKINSIYLPLKIKNQKNLDKLFLFLKNNIINFGGASISMPFKERVIKHLDLKDKSVNTSFNANTILFKRKIIGFNTDFIAIKNMKEFKKIKNIILIGAGALAKSFFKALKKKNFFIYNRSKNKILFFKKNISNTFIVNKKRVQDLKSFAIINTTPFMDKIKIYEFFNFKEAKFLLDCSISDHGSFLQKIAAKYSILYKGGDYLYKAQRELQKKIYLNERL